MKAFRMAMAAAIAGGFCAASAQAVLVTFTGGTVTRQDSTTAVTDTLVNISSALFYEEGGFRFSFYPTTGFTDFSANVGAYYGPGNDVIHAHWATGDFGGITSMEITQIGGGTFDLNYFTLTSNTEFGGAPASGNEQTWVQGFVGGNPTGPAVLLPPEDWGFPAVQIGLGPEFDAVDTVRFFVTNSVDCFGMDDFYINEIPAPSTLVAGALFGGLAMRRRRN